MEQIEMQGFKDLIRGEAAFAVWALHEGRELDAFEHLIRIDGLCSERKEPRGAGSGTDRDAGFTDDC